MAWGFELLKRCGVQDKECAIDAHLAKANSLKTSLSWLPWLALG